MVAAPIAVPWLLIDHSCVKWATVPLPGSTESIRLATYSPNTELEKTAAINTKARRTAVYIGVPPFLYVCVAPPQAQVISPSLRLRESVLGYKAGERQ